MRVTIIISNHNYGKFVADAIESGLAQTHSEVEVIVVDDGSTDDSRRIIETYGDRIRAIFKTNGGMASSQNAGFAASRGDAVIFLDADDMLLPTAAASAAAALAAGEAAHVQWKLLEVDGSGRQTGRLIPEYDLLADDFRARVVAQGPFSYPAAPGGGAAWSRGFLTSVMPIPEHDFHKHSDSYLYTLAPLFGSTRLCTTPQSCYRVHGDNDWAGRSGLDQARRLLDLYPSLAAALQRELARQGIAADPRVWADRSSYRAWLESVNDSVADLLDALPPQARFVLVDDASWGSNPGQDEILGARQSIPFLERGGQYWGAPANDSIAIDELERLRSGGADFIVFAPSALWWLEHYQAFRAHLDGRYLRVLDNERLVVFELSRSGTG